MHVIFLKSFDKINFNLYRLHYTLYHPIKILIDFLYRWDLKFQIYYWMTKDFISWVNWTLRFINQMFSLWFVCVRIWSKVVNTVSVPTSIYISYRYVYQYRNVNISYWFKYWLYWPISGIIGTGWYGNFFFFSFIIFEFL